MVSNAWSSERVQHDGYDGADRRLAGDGLDRCRDETPMVRRGRCARRVSVGSGNTIIFTGPGSDGVWFTNDDVQSSYGANDIIYCGYKYEPETQLYYVRNRTYNPTLGRWIERDPIGYLAGPNLYEYAVGASVVATDPSGLLFGYHYWACHHLAQNARRWYRAGEKEARKAQKALDKLNACPPPTGWEKTKLEIEYNAHAAEWEFDLLAEAANLRLMQAIGCLGGPPLLPVPPPFRLNPGEEPRRPEEGPVPGEPEPWWEVVEGE